MNDCENCVHHIDDVCEHCYETDVTTCTGFRPFKQGKWKVDGALIACNKCGQILLKASKLYNFCPNCGADMRGDNNG